MLQSIIFYRIFGKVFIFFQLINLDYKFIQIVMTTTKKYQFKNRNKLGQTIGQRKNVSKPMTFTHIDNKQTKYSPYTQNYIPQNILQNGGSQLNNESYMAENSINESCSIKQQKLRQYQLPQTYQNVNKTIDLSKLSKRQQSQISQSNCQKRIVELRQRLKNLHYFYKQKIEQQRIKAVERNEVIISVLEDMQGIHKIKVEQYKSALKQAEQNKNSINYVDDRMVNVKQTIEQLLKHSAELKLSNEHLIKQLQSKSSNIKNKQQLSAKLKKELQQYRKSAQNIQRAKLKQSKRKKQLLEMLKTLSSP